MNRISYPQCPDGNWILRYCQRLRDPTLRQAIRVEINDPDDRLQGQIRMLKNAVASDRRFGTASMAEPHEAVAGVLAVMECLRNEAPTTQYLIMYEPAVEWNVAV